MGIMFPEHYEKFLELYPDRAASLYSLAVLQFGETSEKLADRNIDFEWFSLYMPLSLLKKEDCRAVMNEAVKKAKLRPSQICFELPEELLDETDEAAAVSMEALTSEGFLFMLRNFGGDSSPVTKLAGFSPDYVELSSTVTQRAMLGERYEQSVKSIIRLVTDLGSKCIASEVENSVQSDKMAELGCRYCTGKFSGSFKEQKYMRRSASSDEENEENIKGVNTDGEKERENTE